LPALLGRCFGECAVPQANDEAIAVMAAPAKLAQVTRDRQNVDSITIQIVRRRRFSAGEMQAEPLPSDGVSVFQSTVVDQTLSNSQFFRDLSGNVVGIAICFFNPQQAMFAFTRRLETKNLFDLKILQQRLESRGTDRLAKESGWVDGIHTGSIKPHGTLPSAERRATLGEGTACNWGSKIFLAVLFDVGQCRSSHCRTGKLPSPPHFHQPKRLRCLVP